jgi:type I pantothenate kinase
MERVVRTIEAIEVAPGARRVVGLAGGVASGKTTLAEAIAAELDDTAIVSTDAFLLPNAVLDERGLAMRKGFPESYDWARFAETVEALRRGDRLVTVPSYSHVRYDIEPEVELEVPASTTVIIEGVNALQIPPGESRRLAYDLAVYLETAEADQRRWLTERLIGTIRAAVDRPESFYHPMADWTVERIEGFADQVWEAINGPNLHQHIRPSRALADLVVTKDGAHRITSVG